MANKYYVVFEGKTPGIYNTWAECQKETKGVKGAKFKSFLTYDEAKEALEKHKSHSDLSEEEIANSVSVDASCLGVPGKMEYRVVETGSGEVLFSSPVYELGTNNIGEFLSLVKAMQILNEQNQTDRIIFADSQTALSWVKKKKYNTNLVKNDETKALYDLLDESERWLKTTELSQYNIVKWETHLKGEIKADYNRK